MIKFTLKVEIEPETDDVLFETHSETHKEVPWSIVREALIRSILTLDSKARRSGEEPPDTDDTPSSSSLN